MPDQEFSFNALFDKFIKFTKAHEGDPGVVFVNTDKSSKYPWPQVLNRHFSFCIVDDDDTLNIKFKGIQVSECKSGIAHPLFVIYVVEGEDDSNMAYTSIQQGKPEIFGKEVVMMMFKMLGDYFDNYPEKDPVVH